MDELSAHPRAGLAELQGSHGEALELAAQLAGVTTFR